MKAAVFALLFSSVIAQPKEGTPLWDKTIKEHKEGMRIMEEKGYDFKVNLVPQGCQKSHECGMPYRVGGCCFRVEVKGEEDKKEYQNEILKMQGETGGLCYLGSGVEVIEQNGGRVSSYDYSKYMWDNDPQIRATWGAYAPSMPKSFDEFNDFLAETMPDQIARKDMFVQGKCIDEKLHPMNMILSCNKQEDCVDAMGMFNGGCCARVELGKGKDGLSAEAQKFFNEQPEKGGYCAPQLQADYMEKQGNVNLMEYNRYQYENDYVTRQLWLVNYPDKIRKEGLEWDQVIEDVRKAYPQFDNDMNVWFSGKCITDRVPGEPVNWEKVMDKYFDGDMDRMWDGMMDGVDVEMSDNGMSISGEGFSIEMYEDEEGRKMTITMGATTLAASALSLAAMTLY